MHALAVVSGAEAGLPIASGPLGVKSGSRCLGDRGLVSLRKRTVLLGTDLARALPFSGFDGQDRPAAAGAGFGDGLVPERIVTLGVGRAGIEDLAAPGLAFIEASLAAFGAVDPGIFGFFQGFDAMRLHAG